MRLPVAVIWISLAGAGMAQTAAPNRSVSGVVKDAGTGQPLANYSVATNINATWVNDTILMNDSTREVQAVTDEHGRYRLSDLPPGEYRLTTHSVERLGWSMVTRRITIAGRDVEGIDFNVRVDGRITGKVVDENKDAVPNMTVYLISREYYLGAVGYFLKDTARTDDRGEYTLQRVAAGRPYLVMAEKRERTLAALSEAPLNPKLRRAVPLPTYYPNSTAKEGGQALVLRSGERREGVDIELKKSANYCMEGVLSGPPGTAALSFTIEAQSPASGTSSGGGMYMMAPGGTTGPDGKFRICDLHPGGYRLTVLDRGANPNQGQPPSYGVAAVSIADQDLRNLKVVGSPALPLEGEVAWDGEAPAEPVSARVSVWLAPLVRAGFRGENTSARSDIPGTLSYPGLLIDDYSVRAMVNAPGLYIKDVTYSGRSVQYEPLRLGSAMRGAGLRVVVGHDGATLSARVADKDGNPIGGMSVLVMPAEISSEAMLAAALVTGQTDQTGQYNSHTLAPGKYYVVASGDSFDATPESIGRLWRSRNRFKEVELAPRGRAQVSLEPARID